MRVLVLLLPALSTSAVTTRTVVWKHSSVAGDDRLQWSRLEALLVASLEALQCLIGPRTSPGLEAMVTASLDAMITAARRHNATRPVQVFG